MCAIGYWGSCLGDHDRHKSTVETSVVSCESCSCMTCVRGTIGEINIVITFYRTACNLTVQLKFLWSLKHFPDDSIQKVVIVNTSKYMAFLTIRESLRGNFRTTHTLQEVIVTSCVCSRGNVFIVSVCLCLCVSVCVCECVCVCSGYNF